jgi:uncharacterized phage protein (TIGR02218 family)
MRNPSWESSVGALAAFLNSTTQAFMADLFTFTLSGGAILRYTSAQVAVTVNGNTYAAGPVIKRGNTKLNVGIAVDTLSLSLAADSSITVNGVPLMKFVAGGGLDGARLSLERAFSAGPGTAWVGTLPLFQGRVSDSQTSRYEASLTVNSDSELLNVMVPRNVYQPGCSNTLFDASCGLSKVAYGVTATATAATDATQSIFPTARGDAANYFALGFLVCVTGANAGIARTIKSFAAGVFQTIQPWPVAVAGGDTFTAYPGCDKTLATCKAKFSNAARFRGCPWIPAPESIT